MGSIHRQKCIAQALCGVQHVALRSLLMVRCYNAVCTVYVGQHVVLMAIQHTAVSAVAQAILVL
jgi:hypothetical protein